jgi:hypothetical protein
VAAVSLLIAGATVALFAVARIAAERFLGLPQLT